MVASRERAIFFDVGNVLVDDDPFLAEVFRGIYQAIPKDSPKHNIERYLGDVERVLRTHGHAAVEHMAHRCHGRLASRLLKEIRKEIARDWWKLVRVIPGARDALNAFRDGYRLGIIANQPPQIVDFLRQQGLLELFDFVVLDFQYGFAKPDQTLFRMALEESRMDPESAVMIGDRLDNDVIPARRMGMRAILFWLNASQKGWEPEDEWGSAFFEILERLPVPRWDKISPKERPMALVRSWGSLPQAIERAWAADARH